MATELEKTNPSQEVGETPKPNKAVTGGDLGGQLVMVARGQLQEPVRSRVGWWWEGVLGRLGRTEERGGARAQWQL